jgi:3-oxoacyl-[acyl-carrier-protein] synthase-1
MEVPREEWSSIPLLLCLAELERPGRIQELDNQLLPEIQRLLNATFSEQSQCISQGRVAVATAMFQARTLIQKHRIRRVLIAAVDSLLSWPTLSHYEHQGRLLTPHNSNGFMPGEGAGALLVGQCEVPAYLVCIGLGFDVEKAVIDHDAPLKAIGLTQAIKAALAEAACEMHDMDYRITDLSGEQYYFKEATLALSRILRHQKKDFDIWHPAECTGETGAVAGITLLTLADAACRKGYSRGPTVLVHFSNDSGQRAAAILHFGCTA